MFPRTFHVSFAMTFYVFSLFAIHINVYCQHTSTRQNFIHSSVLWCCSPLSLKASLPAYFFSNFDSSWIDSLNEKDIFYLGKLPAALSQHLFGCTQFNQSIYHDTDRLNTSETWMTSCKSNSDHCVLLCSTFIAQTFQHYLNFITITALCINTVHYGVELKIDSHSRRLIFVSSFSNNGFSNASRH